MTVLVFPLPFQVATMYCHQNIPGKKREKYWLFTCNHKSQVCQY